MTLPRFGSWPFLVVAILIFACITLASTARMAHADVTSTPFAILADPIGGVTMQESLGFCHFDLGNDILQNVPIMLSCEMAFQDTSDRDVYSPVKTKGVHCMLRDPITLMEVVDSANWVVGVSMLKKVGGLGIMTFFTIAKLSASAVSRSVVCLPYESRLPVPYTLQLKYGEPMPAGAAEQEDHPFAKGTFQSSPITNWKFAAYPLFYQPPTATAEMAILPSGAGKELKITIRLGDVKVFPNSFSFTLDFQFPGLTIEMVQTLTTWSVGSGCAAIGNNQFAATDDLKFTMLWV